MKLRIPLLTGALALVAFAIQNLPAGVSRALQFDRAALAADSQWWRLITAHVTHFSSNHFIWDVAVLLVLGTVCESESRRRTAFTLGIASIAISIAVWIWQPQFEIYRGLSGLDCALFGLFAAALFRQSAATSKILGMVALLAVTAKCTFELATGSTAFASGVGYVPVPLAHLVGFMTGFAVPWLDVVVSDHIRPFRKHSPQASPHALRARSSTPLATAWARSAPSRSTAST